MNCELGMLVYTMAQILMYMENLVFRVPMTLTPQDGCRQSLGVSAPERFGKLRRYPFHESATDILNIGGYIIFNRVSRFKYRLTYWIVFCPPIDIPLIFPCASSPGSLRIKYKCPSDINRSSVNPCSNCQGRRIKFTSAHRAAVPPNV